MASESGDTSLRGLISSVTADAKKLASAQAELAKLEMSSSGKQAGTAGGMFVGAAAIGGMGGIFILITIAYALVALGLPEWAGFGIVALVLVIVAAILGAIGASKAKKAKGALELSKLEWERTQKALTGAAGDNLPATRPDAEVGQRAKK